jgi:Tol biopolymer transport system component
MRGLTVLLTALLTPVGATSVATAGSTAWVAAGDTPLGVSGDGRFVSYGHSVHTCPFCGQGYAGAVFDRRNGTASDVCESSQEDAPVTISRDARFVLCEIVPSEATSYSVAHVVNRRTGADFLIDGGSGPCCVLDPKFQSDADALSADGRFAVFDTNSAYVVPGDTNHRDDVFVRDRRLGVFERVSLGAHGEEGNGGSAGTGVSGDGRFVVFYSAATNLVAGDTDGRVDVFLRDRTSRTTERVSVATGGGQANGNSGRLVVRKTLQVVTSGLVSDDGRIVVFDSAASDLVPGDRNNKRDVFLRDRQAGTTARVSVARGGGDADGDSHVTSLSPDGRFVLFDSDATDLVPGDTNGAGDVFLYDRQTRAIERVSVSGAGKQGNGSSAGGVISADGKVIAFVSSATNLVRGFSGGVFVHIR